MSYGDNGVWRGGRSAGKQNDRPKSYSGSFGNKATTMEVPKQKLHIDSLNYVDMAEQVMESLCKDHTNLTTSKIRNLLSMVSDNYNDARRNRTEKLTPEMKGRIQYLRLHIAYEAGRDRDVKTFVEKADIFDILKDIGEDREKLITFCHYMEALVAYHRYYGGRELG